MAALPALGETTTYPNRVTALCHAVTLHVTLYVTLGVTLGQTVLGMWYASTVQPGVAKWGVQ